MKRILVIGATGQLGSRTAVYLKNEGYDVIAVGHRNSDNGFFKSVGIEYIGGFALENPDCYKMLPADIDAVVQLAGTMPAHADASPMPYIQSIIVGMTNLCEWMKSTKCRRLVFNTTPSDVGQFFESGEPVNDDAPRSFPKNGGDHAIYAIAKNTAVDILEHYQIAYGLMPIVFRHLTVYGWTKSPFYHLNGETKKLPWRIILEHCVNGETVEVWGDPNRKKELLYIEDFANAVKCALNSECTGIFNLAGDRPYTMDDQVQGLIDVFGNIANPPKKIYCPDKPNTPQNLLSREKAKNILGWEPQFDWWSACREMKKQMEHNDFELLESTTH